MFAFFSCQSRWVAIQTKVSILRILLIRCSFQFEMSNQKLHTRGCVLYREGEEWKRFGMIWKSAPRYHLERGKSENDSGITSEVSLENRYQKQKCSSAYHVRSSVQIGRCSNRKFRSMFSGRHFGRSVQIGKFAPHPEQTEFGSRPWVMWPKIGNLLEIPLQPGLDQVVSALFASSLNLAWYSKIVVRFYRLFLEPRVILKNSSEVLADVISQVSLKQVSSYVTQNKRSSEAGSKKKTEFR